MNILFKSHNKQNNTERARVYGFTLLELLVVVAIIGMILSMGLLTVSSINAKSRDSRRIEDMRQITNALELYHSNNRRYPICEQTPINGTSDCLSAALISDGVMGTAPTDPLNNVSGVCGDPGVHIYCYESENGKIYTLRYEIETDSVAGLSAGWHSMTP